MLQFMFFISYIGKTCFYTINSQLNEQKFNFFHRK